ncbi:hypothetical protein TVAG_036190 [Trichomonas vaginalis G3]|uniref:DUF3447 domain-containing protein n=1 Tax=Trichomonas vaginalis (strain ATCC PRA-98 / G3) TaxID=412133 RepID=A2DAU1_TRIV3|nr:fatty-acyl-CoA binding [Trichomonas vaginalis G3]EAY22594.1 hypothetical protein TVAG_036190 [Trichomonas vaginalis G3]KAI5497326.1 fatty-acyl-CoA binding [Trichomonas vaginalis G3]|eukprot:XP_001583580.1 hypothetical protein [Trichomonas vaginalis G3]
MNNLHYNDFIDCFKDYDDITTRLYRLHITSADEINAFCEEIKNKLLNNSEEHLRDHLKEIISNAEKQNNRYWLYYLILKQKLFNESFRNDFSSHYNEPLQSIIDDDVNLFIPFTERENFNYLKLANFDFIPCVIEKLNIFELCCYYGSVNCFKFLRTKFSAEITKKCLLLSFLGGNPEIMSTCLKYQKPDDECMEYAIMSHNVDFVTFLMNEYKIPIDVEDCIKYNNIQAFFIHFDGTNNINEFVEKICYFPSLWEKVLSILPNFIDNKSQALVRAAKKLQPKNIITSIMMEMRKMNTEKFFCIILQNVFIE